MVKRNLRGDASRCEGDFRPIAPLPTRASNFDALHINIENEYQNDVRIDAPSGDFASETANAAASSPNAETNNRIYDEFCRGVGPKELAQKFGRALASIYRIVGVRRAAKIFELPLEFIPNPEFESAFGDPKAEEKILRFAQTNAETAEKNAESDDDRIIFEAGTKKTSKKGVVRALRKTKRSASVVESSPYWTRIDDVPLLTAAEEAFLFKKFNYLKFKAQKLREKLDPKRPKMSLADEIERLWREAVATKKRIVSANLRLVVSIAKKYAGGSTGFSDLVGDGNVSLMKAVEKFDFSTGNRFSTYATWALYRNFARSIPDERRQLERFRAADVALLELRQDHRSSPRQAERVYREQTSQVAQFMSALNEREREIIELRYGFGAQAKPQTLRQVGENIGVTKERVRQIEIRALAKLRKLAEDAKIEMPEI